MADGHVHADLAGSKLGTQGVDVQGLAAGESNAGGEHGLESLQNGLVGGEVELTGGVVETGTVTAGTDVDHVDGTGDGGSCGLEVASEAVNAFTAQLLGDQGSVVNHLLNGGGRTGNADLVEDVLVVEQTACGSGVGEGVDTGADSVDTLNESTFAETSVVFLSHELGQIQQLLLVIDLNFQRIGGGHLENVRSGVGGECQIQHLSIVISIDLIIDVDLLVGVVELLDQGSQVCCVVTVGGPDRDDDLIAGLCGRSLGLSGSVVTGLFSRLIAATAGDQRQHQNGSQQQGQDAGKLLHMKSLLGYFLIFAGTLAGTVLFYMELIKLERKIFQKSV